MNTVELRDKIIRQRALYLAGVEKMDAALRALVYAEKVLAQDAQKRRAREVADHPIGEAKGRPSRM